MFAVGYIELGPQFAAQAASNFNRSFANAQVTWRGLACCSMLFVALLLYPVQPPFDVWTETPTGGTPNFLTGAGGFLQVRWLD